MSTNSLLTRCKQGAVLSRSFLALAMRTNSVLTPCKQGAVLSRYSIGLGNENKLLTHTLQATCGTLLTSEYLLTFPFRLVQTPYSHLAFASNVRYVSHLGVQIPFIYTKIVAELFRPTA